MTFREFFHKSKFMAFILYALLLTVLCIIDPIPWWVKLILALPLFALGIYLLIEIIIKLRAEKMTVIGADGKGTVRITAPAIIRAVRDACKAVQGINYADCAVSNEADGLHVALSLNIVRSRVLEISEVARELVKNLLEGQVNVKVGKIDIIVANVTYDYKVDKLHGGEEPEPVLEAVYDEDSPSYRLSCGLDNKTFKVPSNHFLAEKEKLRMYPQEMPSAASAMPASAQLPPPVVKETNEPVVRIVETRTTVETIEEVKSEPVKIEVKLEPKPEPKIEPKPAVSATPEPAKIEYKPEPKPAVSATPVPIAPVAKPEPKPATEEKSQVNDLMEQRARKMAELQAMREKK